MKRYGLLRPPTDSYEEAAEQRYVYVDPRDIKGIVHNPAAAGCGIVVVGFDEPVGIDVEPDQIIADREEALRQPYVQATYD